MEEGLNHRPPKLARRFIEWYCKPDLAEDLIGDLNEYFERNVEAKGVRRAKLIYIIDALKFCRAYTVQTPKFFNLFINWIMIGSYIKTSGRNVLRNKLFSVINIVGLAISMSVGLLLVAFIHDLRIYDRFHEKGHRIYRITTELTSNNDGNRFASTSVKAGRLIQEKISGIEEAVILNSNFSGDAKVGDNVVPVSGFYAEPAMYKIFTFPLLKGNPGTALRDPYSIVLTESSAKKLFGNEEAFGKAVLFDTVEYQVTGVMKDLPFFSHLRFESLVSFSTLETIQKDKHEFLRWGNMWSNYVYMLMPEGADIAAIQSQLNAISAEENKSQEDVIQLSLLPMYDAVIGEELSNNIGPTMLVVVLWILMALALIVILSACFNYTNLSIARSMRRFKEIGLRKVIGAAKSQVRMQFLSEAIIVSLGALVLSFGLFLILRPQFIGMAPEIQELVKLDITPTMLLSFVLFAIGVGISAGILPAVFFSRISIMNALRDVSTAKVFKRVTFRRVLVVVQYTLTLMFITTTIIGYKQYKSFLAFDLGFDTSNVLNINLQGNRSESFVNQLKSLREVDAISRSTVITSLGNYWGSYMKYKNSSDSTIVWTNSVDENYIPLHGHEMLAGQNFIARPATKAAATEIIVNEKVLRRFDIGNGDPAKAINEEVLLDNRKLRIVGVMKDYHYGKVDSQIDPVIFSYLTPDRKGGFVNVKLQTSDPVATLATIESMWKDMDRVHTMEAKFYEDAIQEAYSEFSGMIKIIGFLSFLAVSIASMGLFGMVVFTTETRLKEISIRKVMGASSGNLLLMLGHGFMILLGIAAFVALPATYFLFENVILTNFPFHEPVGVAELFIGAIAVLLIAFVMIASQTIKATRTNPAQVLRSE